MQKIAFILFSVVFIIWKLAFSNSLELSNIQFVDVKGNSQMLDASPNSPYLIVPWIDNCPFSARTLNTVEQIAHEGKMSPDHIYAFYLNKINDDKLANHLSVKSSLLTHSAAQKDPNVIQALHEGLFTKSSFKPGDLYYVDSDGSITHIPLRSTTNNDVKPKILEAIHASRRS